VKIDLAGILKAAGKTRQRYVVGRAIVPTSAQEQALRVIYMRVVRGWLDEWANRILPAYRRSLEALPVIGDSVDSTQDTVDEANDVLTRLVLSLGADLEDWAVRVEQWHRKQFASSFTAAGVKLDTLLGPAEAKVTLEATLAENLSLIRSLNDQQRNGISGAVFRGLNNRTPARDVAREIRKVAEVGQSRAELIAADQLQKLSGRLDQERQQQVGADEFDWVHSAKRYPRIEHLERDGKRFAWNSPVGRDDPPGRAIRCGCRARPVIDLEKLLAQGDD
jgi:SPP1 gp7 family putative phage head morphogenesis protein